MSNTGPKIVQHDPKQLAQIRRQVMQGTCRRPDVAILTAADLARMKKESVITTNEQRLQMRKIAEE